MIPKHMLLRGETMACPKNQDVHGQKAAQHALPGKQLSDKIADMADFNIFASSFDFSKARKMESENRSNSDRPFLAQLMEKSV